MKKILIIILILSLSFTTGCWDMKEINERTFPYTVGLDLLDKEDYENGRYDITFTYPNIKAFGNKATQEEMVYLIDTKGNNIFEGSRNVGDKLQKPVYLRELRVVVIPEILAKDKELIKEIIDGLNRDYIISQVIKFVVVKSTAKEILQTKVESKKQADIEGLLYDLLRNEQHSTKFIPSDLNSFIRGMDTCNASLVPLARIEGEDIVVDSNAVFKDYEIMGYIDEEDNKNISIITNIAKSFGINGEYEGSDIVLRIPASKTKRKLIKNGEDLKIRYSVELKGQIEQFIVGKSHELEKEEKLHDIEKTLEVKLKESMEGTIKKIQKDFNADVIGLADYLYKFHPKLWREIEDEYDHMFSDIDIEIDVNLEISRRGLIK